MPDPTLTPRQYALARIGLAAGLAIGAGVVAVLQWWVFG